jgi:hypothetical protein
LSAKQADVGRTFEHFEQLLGAVRELKVVVFGAERDPRQRIAGCSQTAWRTAAFFGKRSSDMQETER